MAYYDPFDRYRSQLGQPLPAGPDIQAAPMAVAAPPTLTGGAGAPGQLSPGIGTAAANLGTALGTRLGGMWNNARKPEVRAARGQVDSPMPRLKPPFPQLSPPYETA